MSLDNFWVCWEITNTWIHDTSQQRHRQAYTCIFQLKCGDSNTQQVVLCTPSSTKTAQDLLRASPFGPVLGCHLRVLDHFLLPLGLHGCPPLFCLLVDDCNLVPHLLRAFRFFLLQILLQSTWIDRSIDPVSIATCYLFILRVCVCVCAFTIELHTRLQLSSYCVFRVRAQNWSTHASSASSFSLTKLCWWYNDQLQNHLQLLL